MFSSCTAPSIVTCCCIRVSICARKPCGGARQLWPRGGRRRAAEVHDPHRAAARGAGGRGHVRARVRADLCAWARAARCARKLLASRNPPRAAGREASGGRATRQRGGPGRQYPLRGRAERGTCCSLASLAARPASRSRSAASTACRLASMALAFFAQSQASPGATSVLRRSPAGPREAAATAVPRATAGPLGRCWHGAQHSGRARGSNAVKSRTLAPGPASAWPHTKFRTRHAAEHWQLAFLGGGGMLVSPTRVHR